jgi:hypothetical protein
MRLMATIVLATALPAVTLAGVAAAANREDIATGLRRWTAGVSRTALLVTAPLWLIVVLRGLLYPAFASRDLENSWGGPTLAGAWAAHLLIGIAALLTVSFVVAALARCRDRGSTGS